MTEQQIIQAILSGDHSKFEWLVVKYQTMVFRTAMGFVHSKEDAEGLTQDVFIRTFQALKTFNGDAEFSTWLYRITVNHNGEKTRLIKNDSKENLSDRPTVSDDLQLRFCLVLTDDLLIE
jgi:RNA polymerase sigma-70 factor, ECF subfamily